MRKVLLLSVALGLMVSADALAATSVAATNRSATAIYSANRLKQNTVQGTVSDEQGPIPGVTVTVVGTNTVVVTDSNGQYRINAPVGSTLRFSSIGYASQEQVVSSTTFNVVLHVSQRYLVLVVVVGYVTPMIDKLYGAVSS